MVLIRHMFVFAAFRVSQRQPQSGARGIGRPTKRSSRGHTGALRQGDGIQLPCLVSDAGHLLPRCPLDCPKPLIASNAYQCPESCTSGISGPLAQKLRCRKAGLLRLKASNQEALEVLQRAFVSLSDPTTVFASFCCQNSTGPIFA